MGKYYENLDKVIQLIKKFEKKNLLAEFIMDCIIIARRDPEQSIEKILEQAKKKRK